VTNFITFLQSFFAATQDKFEGRGDRGATAVEYGLLVGLIAVAIIVTVTTLGGELNGLFTEISNKLPGTAPAAG
jgi:pilus assembly protein Flp/PilA